MSPASLIQSLALFPNYQDWTSLKNRENVSEFGHEDQIRLDRKVPIEATLAVIILPE